MKEKPLVVFLVGPTASGKSETAIKLAELINAEIISADSMQVYRGMDILSAKPSLELRKRIPHHLIDCLDISEEYSAAKFRELSLQLIKKIHARNKIPLITGGTGLYIRALRRGLFPDKGKNENLRNELYRQAMEKGNQYLYERLRQIDTAEAEKIHPNNLRRIIRALEAYEVNKVPLSVLKTDSEGLENQYRIKMFGLERERQELYQRIEARIDKMLQQGLLAEIGRLKSMQLSSTAKQALGIKQLFFYLDGKYTLAEAIALLKRDSRRFAKRQLTWFRQEKDVEWVKAVSGQNATQIIADSYNNIKN